MTLEQAKETMKAREDNLKKMYYPLIKDTCKSNKCMAFVKGVLGKETDNLTLPIVIEDYYIRKDPYCNSPLITGMIYVERD